MTFSINSPFLSTFFLLTLVLTKRCSVCVMAAAAGEEANAEEDNAKAKYNLGERRSDGEYRTCVMRYQLKSETIIRTQDSRALGAKYINETELPSQEDCLLWCCQTDQCNVAIFEKKSGGSCYLFDCGPPHDFKCKFASHHLYSSAVLDMSALEHDPAYSSSHLAQPPPDLHMAALKNLKHQIQAEVATTNQPPVAVTEKPTAAVSPAPPAVAQAAAGGPMEFKTAAPTLATPQQHRTNSETSGGGLRCSHFQFQCRTSKECIAVYNACDGIPQCADGSDESEELGCPTDGRRFGPNSESTSPIVQSKAAAAPPNSEKETERPNTDPFPSSDHELDHQLTSHKQLSQQQQQQPIINHEKQAPAPAASSFGRGSSSKVMDEQMKYEYNVASGDGNYQQPVEFNKQQAWQSVNPQRSQSLLSDAKQKPINVAYARPNMDQNTNLQRPHQLPQSASERTRYNPGPSYPHIDQPDFDPEPVKPHPNLYEEESTIGAKEQHLYNQQQAHRYPESELIEQSQYDKHHYEGPPAPAPPRNTYMKEYYEGGEAGGPYKPHYQINNAASIRQDNQEIFSHNKGAIKETNNGWPANRYVPQPAMYEGREKQNVEAGSYQYPEPDISPVHVHVETHQMNEMMPSHRVSKVQMAEKHADMYNNNNGDNNEPIMNPLTQANWPQNQMSQKAPGQNFQTGQQLSPPEPKVAPVIIPTVAPSSIVTTSSTHQPSVQTPSAAPPKAHNKASSSGTAVKSLARVHELDIAEVDAVHAQRSSESSGAIVALTLGLSITGLLLVLVGCRLRMVRRRLRKGRSYAHDADYLVNGMYL